MLRQVPVPDQLVGATYKELVEHFITANSPQHRCAEEEATCWSLQFL